jgi:hypothetical protein
MGIAKFQEAGAAALASLAAGPIFLTSSSLVDLYLRVPAPIEIDGSVISAFLLFMLPATLIGALLAFVPNMLGTLVMVLWSRRSWLARTPPAWMLVGAASGGGLACALTDGGPDLVPTAAMFLTGGLCAALCRLFVDLGPAGEA